MHSQPRMINFSLSVDKCSGFMYVLAAELAEIDSSGFSLSIFRFCRSKVGGNMGC